MPAIYDNRGCPKRWFCSPIIRNTRELPPTELWLGLACGAALNRTVLLTRPTILPRGYPHVSIEGSSERGHRIVSCGCRDDAQLVITRAQARGSYIEPEAGEIVEWRLPHQVRGICGGNPSREGDAGAEVRDGPRRVRLFHG